VSLTLRFNSINVVLREKFILKNYARVNREKSNFQVNSIKSEKIPKKYALLKTIILFILMKKTCSENTKNVLFEHN
jgi:hypothetical protein